MEEEEDPYCCLPAGYEGRWGGLPPPSFHPCYERNSSLFVHPALQPVHETGRGALGGDPSSSSSSTRLILVWYSLAQWQL